MENNRNTDGAKSDKFFTGKGFYIVLFLCVAVIGVSVWTLVSDSSILGETELQEDVLEEPVADLDEDVGIVDPDTDYESAMWEVPEDAEEVLVEVEAPETVCEVPSEPVTETNTESTETTYEATRAFIWPVIGEIETPYSIDVLLYDTTMSDWRTHDGLDIAAPLGDKVMAASSGTVVELYDDELYGTTVVIDHGEGLCSVYANLAEVPTVEIGDTVLAGETIGAIGSTALCESGKPTHLHFSMTLDGDSVDPNEYLPAL